MELPAPTHNRNQPIAEASTMELMVEVLTREPAILAAVYVTNDDGGTDIRLWMKGGPIPVLAAGEILRTKSRQFAGLGVE